MVLSPEYRTLVQHTYDLQLAVKMQLVPLGAKLVSAELITPDQYEEIRNPYKPREDRAADLIYLVQVKVLQDPKYYADFVAVLENKYVLIYVICIWLDLECKQKMPKSMNELCYTVVKGTVVCMLIN